MKLERSVLGRWTVPGDRDVYAVEYEGEGVDLVNRGRMPRSFIVEDQFGNRTTYKVHNLMSLFFVNPLAIEVEP